MFHWAKPKTASFLGSNFGFEFGAKIYRFWSLWQVIPDWLVLEATGCKQRELSLLCCGSTSMIPALVVISGILAGGILGFRDAGLVCVFAPSSRSCSDVLGSCFLFARSNSSAHKLLQFDRAHMSIRRCFSFGVCVVLRCCLFFWFCFVGSCFLVIAPHLDYGLRTGPCSLLIPQ